MRGDVVVEHADSDLTSFAAENIAAVEEMLVGHLIQYEIYNDGNRIHAVEFAKDTGTDHQLIRCNTSGDTYQYDSKTQTFYGVGEAKFKIDEHTKIFYAYKDKRSGAEQIDPEWSTVGNIASLKDTVYDGPLFYDKAPSSGAVEAVTIFYDNPFACVKFYNQNDEEITNLDFSSSAESCIKVKLNPKYAGKKLLLAGYSDHLMTYFKEAPDNQMELTLNFEKRRVPDCIKAFVWEDIESMQPIDVETLY